jgi:hypothetical protein
MAVMTCNYFSFTMKQIVTIDVFIPTPERDEQIVSDEVKKRYHYHDGLPVVNCTRHAVKMIFFMQPILPLGRKWRVKVPICCLKKGRARIPGISRINIFRMFWTGCSNLNAIRDLTAHEVC